MNETYIAWMTKHEDELYKFDKIENPPHVCPEICGLMKWWSITNSIAMYARHDYLKFESVEVDISEEDYIYLRRCGIEWDFYEDYFKMLII